jgi:hypothetical protein
MARGCHADREDGLNPDQGQNLRFGKCGLPQATFRVDQFVSTKLLVPNRDMAAVMDDFHDTTNTLTETSAIVASFDPNILVEFLTDLAVLTLTASREDLQVSLLSYPDTFQRCARFAADSNPNAIYLRKDINAPISENGILTIPVFRELLTQQGHRIRLTCITSLRSFQLVRTPFHL